MLNFWQILIRFYKIAIWKETLHFGGLPHIFSFPKILSSKSLTKQLSDIFIFQLPGDENNCSNMSGKISSVV